MKHRLTCMSRTCPLAISFAFSFWQRDVVFYRHNHGKPPHPQKHPWRTASHKPTNPGVRGALPYTTEPVSREVLRSCKCKRILPPRRRKCWVVYRYPSCRPYPSKISASLKLRDPCCWAVCFVSSHAFMIVTISARFSKELRLSM